MLLSPSTGVALIIIITANRNVARVTSRAERAYASEDNLWRHGSIDTV